LNQRLQEEKSRSALLNGEIKAVQDQAEKYQTELTGSLFSIFIYLCPTERMKALSIIGSERELPVLIKEAEDVIAKKTK
jgi:hypothetical protein